MSARDALYADLDFELRRRNELERRLCPRAVDLRDRLLAAYRACPITDRRGDALLENAETLSKLIGKGEDVSEAEAATIQVAMRFAEVPR